jgi:glycosyltransferase involved in cell wall biosynthesis
MNSTILPDIDLCVLIPCYNNFDGLIDSIKSINYTENKYVVIVADDGSKETVSAERIQQKLSAFVNFKIVRSEVNCGITKALNLGLEFIYANYSPKFIARLDCGDICSPQRFYKQVTFFENHPDIHLTGTWCYFKNNQTGESYKYSTPTQHSQIKREMHFRNVFIHPTVMWRVTGTSKLKYPEKYPCAEDYGLFYDMISKRKSAIIDEFLVTCEINHQGISILNRSTQLKSRLKVVSFYGRNRLLYLLGAAKLSFLMIIPHQFIFLTKKIIYKTT